MSNKQPAYTRAAPRPASAPKQLAVTRSRYTDLLSVLEEAEQFVDRHSEPWYSSGQELLAKIRAAIARARDGDWHE